MWYVHLRNVENVHTLVSGNYATLSHLSTTRWPILASLPQIPVERSDGLAETGGDPSNETLEGPIPAVDLPLTHQTPVLWNEKA